MQNTTFAASAASGRPSDRDTKDCMQRSPQAANINPSARHENPQDKKNKRTCILSFRLVFLFFMVRRRLHDGARIQFLFHKHVSDAVPRQPARRAPLAYGARLALAVLLSLAGRLSPGRITDGRELPLRQSAPPAAPPARPAIHSGIGMYVPVGMAGVQRFYLYRTGPDGRPPRRYTATALCRNARRFHILPFS